MGKRKWANCQAGCADVRRALRNKAGASTSDVVLGRLLRVVGTVRLRMMPGCPMPEPGDDICARSFPFSPLLGVVGRDDNGPALCFARSPGRRWCRSMMRQPSGPSSSLTLAPALWAVSGGVREREGAGGSAGGGGVSSINQSWCAMRNSSTSWLSRCSSGSSSCSGCLINPGRKTTAKSAKKKREALA